MAQTIVNPPSQADLTSGSEPLSRTNRTTAPASDMTARVLSPRPVLRSSTRNSPLIAAANPRASASTLGVEPDLVRAQNLHTFEERLHDAVLGNRLGVPPIEPGCSSRSTR